MCAHSSAANGWCEKLRKLLPEASAGDIIIIRDTEAIKCRFVGCELCEADVTIVSETGADISSGHFSYYSSQL